MKEIIMPKLGLTMEEGTLLQWHKETGDEVQKGEILFEVETDKTVNEVEATVSGTLGTVLVNEGEKVQVLQVIGYVLEPGESVPSEWPHSNADTPTESPSPVMRPEADARPSEPGDAYSHRPRNVSPRARRLAKEKGISLDGIQGSGADGRVLEQDVIDFVSAQNSILPSRLQRITAKRMSQSFATVPHFYLKVEVDASKLVEWRDRLLPAIDRASGIRLTFTDLLILLVAKTLKIHPRVNASWVDGHIRVFDDAHIGLATAAEDGLIVPVLKHADRMTVGEIAQERKRLIENAIAGKLSLDDLEGGTFTLSNLGMFRIDEFLPIINPPQSAILAVGRIAERVVAENGRPVVKPTVCLVLSVDHRVLDGTDGAQFLEDLERAIEEPDAFFAASFSPQRCVTGSE